eukprot:scaffold16900_cov51-Phaeocystis_antarctica.AAC.1
MRHARREYRVSGAPPAVTVPPAVTRPSSALPSSGWRPACRLHSRRRRLDQCRYWGQGSHGQE